MRAVLLDVPASLLEERRRRGLDKRDERWDGVLHMVPPPPRARQALAQAVFRVLAPLAERRGLVPHYETGLFATADDYRVPDQLYAFPEHLSDRGAEGAELVVEVRSTDDETYYKLDWYTARGVREVLVLHPASRAAEVYVRVGEDLRPVQPDDDVLRSRVLTCRLHTVDGPRLRIEWEGGAAEV